MREASKRGNVLFTKNCPQDPPGLLKAGMEQGLRSGREGPVQSLLYLGQRCSAVHVLMSRPFTWGCSSVSAQLSAVLPPKLHGPWTVNTYIEASHSNWSVIPKDQPSHLTACISGVSEATRAGPQVEGMCFSFKTQLKPGVFPPSEGVLPLQGHPLVASSVPSAGLPLELSWRANLT